MHPGPLVAVLVAVALLACARSPLVRHRLPVLRRLLLLGAVALVASALPWHGVDVDTVRHGKLLISLAATGFLVLWACRVPWADDRRRRLVVLSVLAALSLLNHFNYLSFHGVGTRAFVHLHDVAHNYMGARYRAELGYADLYTAILRAEAEITGNRFRAIEARDLATYDLVHIRTLLQRSDPVRARFSEERWTDFRADVAHFRERLTTEQWGRILDDHGYNSSPVWSAVAMLPANLVTAGSRGGLLLLALVDPLLLALAFVVVARSFGLETMLLALIQFGVLFGAGFSWIGGSFLRYGWFAALLLGLCALHRRRALGAGLGLAAATALRVFPALLLLPLAAKVARRFMVRFRAGLYATGPAARRGPGARGRFDLRFAASMLVTGIALGALAMATAGPRGPQAEWSDFRTNMDRHLANIAPNVVGLTESLIVSRAAPRQVTAEEFRASRDRRWQVYRWQRLLLLPLLFVAVAWAARRRTDLGAVALGLPLLFAGLNLAAYDYLVLVVLVLAHRAHPRRLVMILGLEAATWSAWLFVERDAILHADRGWLLVALLVALEVERWRSRRSASVALAERDRATGETAGAGGSAVPAEGASAGERDRAPLGEAPSVVADGRGTGPGSQETGRTILPT